MSVAFRILFFPWYVTNVHSWWRHSGYNRLRSSRNVQTRKRGTGYDSENQEDDSGSDSELDDQDESDVENRPTTKRARKETQPERSRTVTLSALDDDSDAGSVQEHNRPGWDK